MAYFWTLRRALLRVPLLVPAWWNGDTAIFKIAAWHGMWVQIPPLAPTKQFKDRYFEVTGFLVLGVALVISFFGTAKICFVASLNRSNGVMGIRLPTIYPT